MSHLSVRDVSIRFGETVAVNEVSLEVEAGEIVAVIGPSGCGKSSLLRAIAGLEPLAGGSIWLGGEDLAGVPTHRRDLGLMFQSHALFPHLPVGGNIAFGLKMQRAARSEADARVEELLGLVGLKGFVGRSVEALSGGEAQRVALARALAPSPALLMLDEPLGSLDRLLREQLVHDLRALFVELGVTALHVTHDQAEAFSLADKVVVLQDGVVQQIGRPPQVWARPASAFVARFLGHPNVWNLSPGESDSAVLVPIPAIKVVGVLPDESLQRSGAELDNVVVVERSEFREGRFRITARSVGSGLFGLDTGPVAVVFDAAQEARFGEHLLLEIERQQLVGF